MRIGFVGLGSMGRGMAANLQRAGYDLAVNDLSIEMAAPLLDAGASWAGSPRATADGADIVFTSLPTPSDVEAVGTGEEGLLAGLRPGTAWFDLSTNAVDSVRSLHRRAAEAHVAFLDAPVSGGPAGAATRDMAIWVGGDQAVFERHEAVLEAMSDRPRHIGEVGAGTIAKLAHNMAAAAMNSVLAEVLTLGVKAGLEPVALWEAIRTGAVGRARSFDQLGPRFLQGRLDPPSFALRLLQKDIALALQLSRDVSVPMRLCEMVALDITEAVNRGWSGRDAQSVLLLQQERAGIPPFALTADEVKTVYERS